jgi:hypothetical protein
LVSGVRADVPDPTPRDSVQVVRSLYDRRLRNIFEGLGFVRRESEGATRVIITVIVVGAADTFATAGPHPDHVRLMKGVVSYGGTIEDVTEGAGAQCQQHHDSDNCASNHPSGGVGGHVLRITTAACG